ncbi:cell invasion protein SipA [uncultured Selenomonas sp.]|uniref:cell invasion protein SipA n=1 Tax=uncultured Selenomonas sp. TaxID=159275 RepID=UPI0028D70CEB|nr:cell invasion protein SipA [uncultured Selenomonas sp.]
MMTTKMMKRTAVAALVGAMSYGAAGAAEVSAHALSMPAERASYTSLDGRAEVQQLAWGGRKKSKSGKKYSQGSVNTAVIAGAVIGAIIAKNT